MEARLPEGLPADLSPLQLYLHQAAETPLLTAAEERACADAMHRGDRARSTLLDLSAGILTPRIDTRTVRRTLNPLRTILTRDVLKRAETIMGQSFGARRVKSKSNDVTLLRCAMAVARQKIPVRNRQTLDSDEREILATLLQVARFTETTLVALAKRLTDPDTRQDMTERQRAVAEGEQARDLLRRSNLLLVVAMARQRKFCWGDLSLLDRIQEGNIGLCRAVDGFDPKTFDTRFSTYACPWIEQAIDRAIKDTAGAMRCPRSLHDLSWRFRCLLGEAMHAPNGVTADEMMEEMSLKPYQRDTVHRDLRRNGNGVFSIREEEESLRTFKGTDALLEESEAEAVRDRIEHFRSAVQRLLDVLTPREAAIIRLRLGLDGIGPWNQQQIGDMFAVTRAAIQQAEIRAIAKLEAAADVNDEANGNGTGHKNGVVGHKTHAAYAPLFRRLEAL